MIVKNLLVVGVVAGFASAAAAEDAKANWGVSGKIRMDAVQSSTDTTEGSAAKTTAKSSEIMLNRAQFTLTGTRGSDTMVLRYFADENVLDIATISHKVSDMVSATFGRMRLLAQSWERDSDTTDQYMVSMAGGMHPDNANGAEIDLSFGDHSIAIQALQGVSTIGDSKDGATFNKSGGLSTAIQYRGEINKMIRPLITYTMVKPSSSATASVTTKSATSTKSEDAGNYGNGYQTQLGAGVEVDAGGASVDLEYDSVTTLKTKVPTDSKDQKVTSMIAQVKYPVGSTTPFFKVTMDNSKLGADKNAGDKKQTKMALGVEHKLDASCRLHAVYTSSNTTETVDASTSNKVAATGFNLGVTASM